MASRGKGVWGMGKMGEDSGSYRRPVMERVSHENKRYSIGNIANDIVTILYGDR